MKTLIYYHSPCMDGLAAAWVLRKAIPGAVAKPARFGDPPPLDEAVGFDRVIFADVCFSGEYMKQVEEYGREDDLPRREVVVLDHHATSEKMVTGSKWSINQSMSGAGLALSYAVRHGLVGREYQDIEPIVAYVQDRDLWRWEHYRSREVSAYLKAQVRTFADLDDAATLLINDFKGLVATGAVLLRAEERRLEEATRRAIQKAGVVFINAEPDIRSELAEYIVQLVVVCVVVWSVAEDGTVRCSARGPGARQWCEARGGGGHDNAAGCEITMAQMTEYLDPARPSGSRQEAP